MSEYYQWIVDCEATAEEASVLGHEVFVWLLENGIVGDAEERFGSVVYPVKAGAAERGYFDFEAAGVIPEARWNEESGTYSLTYHPVTEVSGWMEIEASEERRVFHTAENFPERIKCPVCGNVRPESEMPWLEAVGSWYASEGDETLTCDMCGGKVSVTEWILDPDWGYGYLGFCFHWPITDALEERIASLLGHRTRRVFVQI